MVERAVHGCPHFHFHVIFISAYPVVRVKIYTYVNMLGRNDLITALTNSLFSRKESNRCKPAATTYAKGRNRTAKRE